MFCFGVFLKMRSKMIFLYTLSRRSLSRLALLFFFTDHSELHAPLPAQVSCGLCGSPEGQREIRRGELQNLCFWGNPLHSGHSVPEPQGKRLYDPPSKFKYGLSRKRSQQTKSTQKPCVVQTWWAQYSYAMNNVSAQRGNVTCCVKPNSVTKDFKMCIFNYCLIEAVLCVCVKK